MGFKYMANVTGCEGIRSDDPIHPHPAIERSHIFHDHFLVI